MPTRTAYLSAKVLLTLCASLSGAATLAGAAPVAETFARLDLPSSLMGWMGAFKVAGAIALWFPNSPHLREWAYAGFVFAMSGATYLHFAAGDALAQTGGPIFLLALALAGYALERRQSSGEVPDAG